MIVTIIIFFSLACVTGLVLTALIRELAPRIGLTDRPDEHRKLHRGEMPLGGGVAVLLATISVIGVVMVQPNPFRKILWQEGAGANLITLLPAAIVIVVVGLLDDRFGLRGWHKLLGQIVAASILISGGIVIRKVSVFGMTEPMEFGVFAIPCTLFWFLGAINALNLLDGIDGLAAMMGVILVSTIAIMAGIIEFPRHEVMIVGFVFAGVLVGFMRFNFPPASIFLGDAGSMLIGLVVGTLAIQGALKGPGTVLLAAPLAVWAIPILDSTAAVLRRKLTGRSIYSADRSHLHHRLLSLLGSNRRVLAGLAGCCLLTSAAALFSVYWKDDRIALLVCSAIVIMFIVTGVFGRAEVLLLGSRIRRVGRSFVAPMTSRQIGVHHSVIRLQGSRQWELLWQDLVDSAEEFSLSKIHLDVNLPALEEGFHASWERPNGHDREGCWQMDVPLVVNDRPVGRLLIAGECREESPCGTMEQLLQVIRSVESQLLDISQQEAPVSTGADNLPVSGTPSPQAESVVSRQHPK
ncbi:MAG: hypothetical protein A2V70_11720 [Planctomycetes bacterium RBG_13_63_9]|nr:MAG: hypothetical protein A2V70_11720 [Planctomycetes bacterium RBG_13_63_9]